MSGTEILLAILLLLAIGAVAFLVYSLTRKKEGGGEGMDMLLKQMEALRGTVDQKLGEGNKSVAESLQNQFKESQKLIKEITQELTSVKETGRQVVSFADQLKNLQDILKNPKQRGILGEYFLGTLLENTLAPENFKLQYAFPNGTIVDAAVFVKEKIIPIDSKFSLENYNRMAEAREPAEKERLEKLFVNDLKLRIQETAKYIQPEQGTTDFAFMFIPHEAIYYDLLVNKVGGSSDGDNNLIQKAAGKDHVIIVSPTSFLAYLQTVVQGLRALQIEDQAKTIIKNVGELGKHLRSYEEYHGKLGNSLGTVVNHFNASGKELKKVDKDILRITGTSPELETALIDGPDKEGE
ncbi:MAG: DNA recombination protein RmuC [Patescibacteria group bacterium]